MSENKSNKKKFIFLLLVGTLLFSSAVVPYFGQFVFGSEGGVSTLFENEESNWVTTERGINYIIRQNPEDSFLHSWESAPMWVWDGTKYVPYIYFRNEAKKCYVVKTALISAEIYDTGGAKYFDTITGEERVKSEVWKVSVDDGGVWKEAILSSVVTFNVTETPTSIIIETERATTKPSGTLIVQYIFREGMALKHNVVWVSDSVETQIVEVEQVWDLKLSTNKVILDDGSLVTSSIVTNSTTYSIKNIILV